MPQLKDIVSKRETRSFRKKSYRPWDLTGTKNELKNLNDNLTNCEEEKSAVIETELPKKLMGASNKKNNALYKQEDNIKIDGTHLSLHKLEDINETGQEESLIKNGGSSTRPENDLSLKLLIGVPGSLEFKLNNLSGLQKKVLQIVFEVCLKNKSLSTDAMQTSKLARKIKTTIGTTKMAIKRLVDKGIIQRGAGKTAKGGFICLELPRQVFSILEKNESFTELLTETSENEN